MSEQQNIVLKESFALRRAGGRQRLRHTAGLLVPLGALLVSVFASATSSAVSAPAATLTAGTEAAAQTIVHDPLSKPADTNKCREGWSMSRLHAGTVWVGDAATGRIDVYRLDGTRLRVVDTRLGRDRLTGFRVESDGSLSVLDVRENRTVRLRASQT